MKSILLATMALARYFGFRVLARKDSGPLGPSTPPPEQMTDVTRRFLMNIVLPV
jgi:hypothetical protein